jgi:enterochelin esterase-like enzyme
MGQRFAARLVGLFCCGLTLFGQQPAKFRSTEIHPDHTATFRFDAPKAAKVEVLLENDATRLLMQRQSDGVWTATSGPLAPEIYGYRFAVDGRAETMRDPQNPAKRYGNSLLVIPGSPPKPWERTDTPRGTVTHHSYTTKTVTGLPDNRSEFVVYTPPGYDPKARPYPVLYLLHVWGDDSASWVEFAQADVILDNLIAEGKARPMVVVMPLGYGETSFSKDYLWSDRAAVARNLALFSKTLLTEVMPQVEGMYNVRRDAEGRAILGASMGGLESLAIGLSHPETFGWVGGESAALQHQDFGELLASFNPKAPERRLVWMVCAKDDELAGDNRRFVDWLRAKGQPITFEEPNGTHSYIVWREGLVRFGQMIFPVGN